MASRGCASAARDASRSLRTWRTATAAFLGYTEKAVEPARIGSLLEYERLFGGPSEAGYDLHAALRLFFANGGARAFIVPVGRFGAVDASQLRAGLDAVDAEAEPAILLAPDALRLPKDDYHAFVREMIERAAASRRRMVIADLHSGDALPADFLAAMAPLAAEARSFGAVYHPWLKAGAEAVPPSAAVAGIYARTDTQRAVWKAPANERVLGIDDLSGAGEDAPDGPAVNAIRKFPGKGILVWGARTLADASAEWKYVNVRRTLIFVEHSIEAGLQWAAFEPNDERTWSLVRSAVENFLIALWKDGALQGIKPQEAFFVQCDRTTMTQDDIDNGRLILLIGMALVKPAEFVILRIGLKASAA